ncbi:speedy protein E4A-like [Microtus ochrogaster]|uniref:Speedy protein E4A-like n=1 Tax=Microtus ochrogaster TaxID=79684 RepID=A0ABM1UU55_MICOH|nr:speedy protein E4A-like [Microtus ochrogaster]
MGEGTSCVDSVKVQEEGGIDQSLGFVEGRKQVGKIVTAGQLSLCSERQSPQLGITRPSPGVLTHGEISGPAEPRAEANSQPLSTSPKRKRNSSSDSEDDLAELLDPEPVWSVETLCGLRMKLRRRRASIVRPEYHKVFTRLLEDPVVKKFLAWDKTLRVSDKYLLSMVIAYFSRAGLFSWQYRPIHFFLALIWVSREECEEIQAYDPELWVWARDRTNLT